ncbi:MAG: PQQ-binding-like beta-propeller repeat protein [Ktedonobacterales bacterium]
MLVPVWAIAVAALGVVLAVVALVLLLRARRRVVRIVWAELCMLLIVASLGTVFAAARPSGFHFNNRPAPVSPGLQLFLTNPTGVLSGELTALRATDGSVSWQRTTSNGVNDYTLADGVLYLAGHSAIGVGGTTTNSVTALRASDGTQLWNVTIAATGIIGVSPVVAGGNVYVGLFGLQASSPRVIVALRASDGSELWRRAVDNYSPGPPVVAGGGLVYVPGMGAWRASDGATTWTRAIGGQWVYDAGTIYVLTDPGHAQILALRAADGMLLWTADESSGDLVVNSLDVSGGTVYVGLVHAVNDSQAYLDALDAATGARRWRDLLPGNAQGTTVAGTVAYVGTTGGLFALDAATGTVLWHRSTGRYIAYHAPRIAGGVLFVASTNDQRHTDNLCFFGCSDLGEADYVNAVNATDGSFYWRQPLQWAGSPLDVGS